MTNDEIIQRIVAKHFKRLESCLMEIELPKLVYVAVSKEFRFMEQDLKEALAFQDEDLQNVLNK